MYTYNQEPFSGTTDNLSIVSDVVFFYILFFSRARSSSLGTAATILPTVPAPDGDDCGAIVKCEFAREAEVLGVHLLQCHFAYHISYI